MTAPRSWKLTPSGPRPLNPRTREIVELIKAKVPMKEIAERFGITVGRVSQIRRSAKIPRRINPVPSE